MSAKKKQVPKSPPAIRKIRTAHGVAEYMLSNGLRFLFKRDNAAPVVAVCVTFHVGSRNEAAGHTGATHILEHLLFKDSKHFNRANGKPITGYLDEMGALMNATTWLDRTNYFELLPREKLPEALAMEADRMRGSLFSAADLASEMTVVRNEYERGRNDPYEILDEAVTATAITEHPYRIPTIGLKEDIEGATVEKLREFYDTFYWPENATVAVFGDVSARETEALILKHFGPIPRPAHPMPSIEIVEPTQTAPRTLTVQKAAGVSLVELAYQAPRARDDSFAAVALFLYVLAGGYSSRMQQSIVDKGFASDIRSSAHWTHDPCLATFTATVAPSTSADNVLRKMRAEVALALKDGVTAEEVSRARARLLSESAQERDGVFREIRTVSEALAAGDWTLAYRFAGQVKRMTAARVNRAARMYFSKEKETAGILLDTTRL